MKRFIGLSLLLLLAVLSGCKQREDKCPWLGPNPPNYPHPIPPIPIPQPYNPNPRPQPYNPDPYNPRRPDCPPGNVVPTGSIETKAQAKD